MFDPFLFGFAWPLSGFLFRGERALHGIAVLGLGTGIFGHGWFLSTVGCRLPVGQRQEVVGLATIGNGLDVFDAPVVVDVNPRPRQVGAFVGTPDRCVPVRLDVRDHLLAGRIAGFAGFLVVDALHPPQIGDVFMP